MEGGEVSEFGFRNLQVSEFGFNSLKVSEFSFRNLEVSRSQDSGFRTLEV
jgi:hypothetical protein